MSRLKKIFIILVMIVLIPLYSWSQDSIRCYSRTDRELIANHNLERLWCLDELYYTDSLIALYSDKINFKDSLINLYKDSNKSIINNNKLITERLNESNKKVEKKNKRIKIFGITIVVETLLLLILWQR